MRVPSRAADRISGASEAANRSPRAAGGVGSLQDGRAPSRLGCITQGDAPCPESPKEKPCAELVPNVYRATVAAPACDERWMKDYQPYVEHLNELVKALVRDSRSALTFNAEAVNQALDGGAPAALRRLVAIQERRDAGAFFTSSALAERAWMPLLPTLDHRSIVVDPACGAGSLLIPCVRALLPRAKAWEVANQFRGRDIVSGFVEAARARLTLTIAISQSTSEQVYPGNLLFPELRHGDAFEQMEELLKGATHVVLNPPYNPIIAPEGCDWAAGKINHAALFTELTMRHMPIGSRIVAILPEVLRSGPRYAKWRQIISALGDISQLTPWGAFDSQTDVDVFGMYATRSDTKRSLRNLTRVNPLSKHNQSNSRSPDDCEVVSRYFNISVGTVVPHRHAEEGPVRPFATARELPAWKAIARLPSTRKYSGRCDVPPFVAIRRTSRPGQVPRTLATIVRGKKPVAVDNHLIVARPIDGSLDQCQKLLDRLRQPQVTEWLDERYRCHHLPVEAIRLIPWERGGDTDG